MRPEAISRLADFFAADERVFIAYLFGSQAQGKARPRSDVDVAVRVQGHPSLEERDALRTEWEEALSGLLGRTDVEVVVLNGADLSLCHQVVTHGRVLFAWEPAWIIEDWNRTFKEYFDVKPLWEVLPCLSFTNRIGKKRRNAIGSGGRMSISGGVPWP